MGRASSDRRRRITEDLLMGERTMDVAGRHGLSQGRISQLRRELMHDWRRFCGDGEAKWRAWQSSTSINMAGVLLLLSEEWSAVKPPAHARKAAGTGWEGTRVGGPNPIERPVG